MYVSSSFHFESTQYDEINFLNNKGVNIKDEFRKEEIKKLLLKSNSTKDSEKDEK